MIPLQVLGFLPGAQQLSSRVLPVALRAVLAVVEGGCGCGVYSAGTRASSSSFSSVAPQRSRGRRRNQQQQQEQQQLSTSQPWGRIPDEDLPVQYSLRPSVMSPLHSVYRKHQELQRWADFAALGAAAQIKLGEEITAATDAEVPSELARRRKALGALTNAYAAALSEGPLTPPARPDQGQGYTLMLEQRLADEQPDFIEFSRVLSGERDVWDYWFEDFAPRYDGLPGLAPLVKAFSRPSIAEVRAHAAPPPLLTVARTCSLGTAGRGRLGAAVVESSVARQGLRAASVPPMRACR
ncbi:hypothetical protein MNEG_5740 [Monoraphidium neglectum]|uniref:Uncharacterized protein n=1 Tax=Monoraphidium neglectum TaxID=145388 RepID=A0A0D2L5B6_9CHLO|nr:hypothetical protein MNEG_5740 [Monoraphidium neglectum]KIZ02224.1 hypothetical protein MNEG_5740 [Monoraphidium neglectum]|eukprot:XP_013901243.1 hypothetical protein MNEG_5740 [Monoraphidium neglectum]